jgi:transcriptional antiterminator RfaH
MLWQGEITKIMFDYWALATLQPFGETIAVENCSQQGFESYSPICLGQKVIRGRKVEFASPLFPGYLFVKLTDRWRSLFGTRGITGLILDGDPTSECAVPMRIRTSEIARIRSAEVDGVIILEPRARARRRFARGDEVRTKAGTALENRLGVFSGETRQDRLKILFNMFGREVGVYVRESDLTAI